MKENKEVERFFNKGIAVLEDGNWLMAVQLFKKCQEMDREYLPAYQELAEIYYQNGQMDAALEEVKAALVVYPDDIEASFMLGRIYLAKKRYTDALRVFKRLENTVPGFAADIFYNIAVAYKNLDRPEDALEYFKAALDEDPSYYECLEQIGRLELEAGRLKEAADAFSELIDMDPGNINAHHTLGEIYSRQSLWKEAIAQWETVLALAPNTDEAMREIGWALGMVGEYENSVETLKKALEMNPSNLQARIDLGAVFMNSSRPGEAISELEKARKEDPGNPLIKKFLSDARALMTSTEGKGKD